MRCYINLFLNYWIISGHLGTKVLAATGVCGIGLKKSPEEYTNWYFVICQLHMRTNCAQTLKRCGKWVSQGRGLIKLPLRKKCPNTDTFHAVSSSINAMNVSDTILASFFTYFDIGSLQYYLHKNWEWAAKQLDTGMKILVANSSSFPCL